MMRSKLGLQSKAEDDNRLIEGLENCLTMEETDMTIFYRKLINETSSCLKESTNFICVGLYLKHYRLKVIMAI